MMMPATTERIASNPESLPLPNTMGRGPISTNPPTEALPPLKEPRKTSMKPSSRMTTPTA